MLACLHACSCCRLPCDLPPVPRLTPCCPTPPCCLPAVHDAENPEYSILKQRIARRLRHEGETDESVQQLSLVDITKVAERTISDDLEYLISKTVDTNKADYAGAAARRGAVPRRRDKLSVGVWGLSERRRCELGGWVCPAAAAVQA